MKTIRPDKTSRKAFKITKLTKKQADKYMDDWADWMNAPLGPTALDRTAGVVK